MAFMCKELGVLPQKGGILDQDHKHIRWLKAGLEAIAEKEAKDQKDAERKSGNKSRVRH